MICSFSRRHPEGGGLPYPWSSFPGDVNSTIGNTLLRGKMTIRTFYFRSTVGVEVQAMWFCLRNLYADLDRTIPILQNIRTFSVIPNAHLDSIADPSAIGRLPGTGYEV